MPRGGRRPGSGARKHNLNAVKHGRYSPQLRLIARVLLQNPVLRAAYQRLCASVAKQALQPANPINPTNSTYLRSVASVNTTPPRPWLAVIADGKLTRYDLPAKN